MCTNYYSLSGVYIREVPGRSPAMENEPGPFCSIREMIKKSAMSLTLMKNANGTIVSMA